MTCLKKEEQKKFSSGSQSLVNQLIRALIVQSVVLSGTMPGRGMGTCPAVGRRLSLELPTLLLPTSHPLFRTVVRDKQGCHSLRLPTIFLLASHLRFHVTSVIGLFHQPEAGAVTKEEFTRKPQQLYLFR